MLVVDVTDEVVVRLSVSSTFTNLSITIFNASFATHSKYVAYAELCDVKVTHFPDDSVIWQGSEDGMVSGKEFPDSASLNAV